MGQIIVAGLANGSIYGLIALGLVMVYRGSKVLNFAQVEIGTFAAYVAWWLINEQHLPWLLGALIGVIAAAAISAVFEQTVVRRMTDAPRLTVAVATIGLLLLLIALEVRFWGASPAFLRSPFKGIGPSVLKYHVSPIRMVAFVFSIAAGLGINRFLRQSDFGLAVLASAQDPNAVRMMGVRLAWVSQFTWVSAGVLGAIGVILFEPSIGNLSPGGFSAGANTLFVPALAAALLAGMTDLTRAFLAGLAVGVVQAVAVHQFSDVTWLPGAGSAVLFLAIVAALLFRPAGLATSEVS